MPTVRPSILISYAHWAPWVLERYDYRDWVLDSGAFTAWREGKPIELSAYIDFCLSIRDVYPRLTSIFALDVIGDAAASVRNAEEMTRQGLTVIPTFHLGSPEEFLFEIAAKYDKIALGGMVHAAGSPRQPKRQFTEQCFARVWPKKIHGFGFSGKQIERLPWHSVDFSNWIYDPSRWGLWGAFGHKRQSGIRDHDMHLSTEVEHYRRMENKIRAHADRSEFTIYLAVDVSPTAQPGTLDFIRYDRAFPLKPELRPQETT